MGNNMEKFHFQHFFYDRNSIVQNPVQLYSNPGVPFVFVGCLFIHAQC